MVTSEIDSVSTNGTNRRRVGSLHEWEEKDDPPCFPFSLLYSEFFDGLELLANAFYRCCGFGRTELGLVIGPTDLCFFGPLSGS
jgi:hypothetical protein